MIHLQTVRQLVNCFMTSHLIILFIQLQFVREPGQLFKTDFLSDHPILILFIRLQSVRELRQLFLILPSHPLHPSAGRTWTWSIVYDLSSDHPIPSSSVSRVYVKFVLRPLIWSSHPILSRKYAKLVNCLNTLHLIIPSHPLQPPPERTWTWSIVYDLIWSSYPIFFIGLQSVREICF